MVSYKTLNGIFIKFCIFGSCNKSDTSIMTFMSGI